MTQAPTAVTESLTEAVHRLFGDLMLYGMSEAAFAQAVRGILATQHVVPDGFIVMHLPGFLEAAEKAIHGSTDTLAHLASRATWCPAPVKVEPEALAAATQERATREQAREAAVSAVALKHLNIAELATRNADQLDFHSLAVWQVKAALQAAFEAGARQAQQQAQATATE